MVAAPFSEEILGMNVCWSRADSLPPMKRQRRIDFAVNEKLGVTLNTARGNAENFGGTPVENSALRLRKIRGNPSTF